jgi:hypothetical protein
MRCVAVAMPRDLSLSLETRLVRIILSVEAVVNQQMKPFRPFQPSEGSTSPFDIATYHDERDAVRSRSPHGVTAQPTIRDLFQHFHAAEGILLLEMCWLSIVSISSAVYS